jgi:membrane protease YdiL (CAAX protease family)
MYWFLIFAQGLVLPFLQVFLAEGFLFNYLFRDNVGSVAIFGIVFSCMIFSLVNFQLNVPVFLFDMVFGLIFAWAYLYSQNIVMPLYLAILNGLLMVMLV